MVKEFSPYLLIKPNLLTELPYRNWLDPQQSRLMCWAEVGGVSCGAHLTESPKSELLSDQ